jgi:polycomb protein SUZ12
MQPNNAFNCAAGIERLYYHTTTTLPILPGEINYDSDDELVPEWLQMQTEELINDFTDMNEGEKNMMRIWDLFLMKNNPLSVSRMYHTCERFIEEHGQEIVNLNLKKIFEIHLSNLMDYGLLTLVQKKDLVKRFIDKFSLKKTKI